MPEPIDLPKKEPNPENLLEELRRIAEEYNLTQKCATATTGSAQHNRVGIRVIQSLKGKTVH